MPLPEQKPGTVANNEIKIKEKVAQNCWPILAHFSCPITIFAINVCPERCLQAVGK
jgi:hypothetical protein